MPDAVEEPRGALSRSTGGVLQAADALFSEKNALFWSSVELLRRAVALLQRPDTLEKCSGAMLDAVGRRARRPERGWVSGVSGVCPTVGEGRSRKRPALYKALESR
jgi:hypothetical protein